MEPPRTFPALGDALKAGYRLYERLDGGGFLVRKFDARTSCYELAVVNAPSRFERLPQIPGIDTSLTSNR